MANLRSLISRVQVEAWSKVHARFPWASFGLPQRSSNPYASHVPALVGISSIIEPTRVVEFGCGMYSTPTFLNRSAFPRVIELLSLENDLSWAQSIAERTSLDARLHIVTVDGAMHLGARLVPLGKYDLVFVDDSTCVMDRGMTIKAVGAAAGPASVVVIHDFEVATYWRALPRGIHVFVFDAIMPLTAVCWKDRTIDPRRLHATNKMIKRFASKIPLEATDAWYHALHTAADQP